MVGEIARKLGIPTVAVVSMPFKLGRPRASRRQCAEWRNTLRENVDMIIVINNQKVLDIIEKNDGGTGRSPALTDQVSGNAVPAGATSCSRNGTIHVDFNDIRRPQ